MSKIIFVNDKMQQNYWYELTEPVGQNFDPDFKPELTPKEMLEIGVFGGHYLTDCRNEFPKDWFENAKISPDGNLPELNFFHVKASQSLATWRKNHWIHPDDPRGWFQWYCRYYLGRRHEDDDRQIKRWKGIQRHVTQLKTNCRLKDWNCRPKQRQALLHWAYDSREM